MAMPHQIGVTIQAPVAVDRVPELRAWLAELSRKGLAEGPFDFAHVRGLHFARFYLLEETADLEGRSIPASLVFMSAVDAPLRRHLADLVDVAGEGMDQAFRHCTGYPGPDARRRAKIAWLRGHRVAASAFYVNTVGAGWSRSGRRRRCAARWRTTSTGVTGAAAVPPRCAANCRPTSPGA